MLVAGLLAALAGMSLDHLAPRFPFGMGVLTLGLAAMGLSRVSQISHLYWVMAVLFAPALTLLNLGTLSAQGLSQAGQGFGIFVLTPAVGWLISHGHATCHQRQTVWTLA